MKGVEVWLLGFIVFFFKTVEEFMIFVHLNVRGRNARAWRKECNNYGRFCTLRFFHLQTGSYDFFSVIFFIQIFLSVLLFIW